MKSSRRADQEWVEETRRSYMAAADATDKPITATEIIESWRRLDEKMLASEDRVRQPIVDCVAALVGPDPLTACPACQGLRVVRALAHAVWIPCGMCST